ncbi:hypothetical protein EDEG_00044, partial [Edhazardia aedis USNM 41457]
ELTKKRTNKNEQTPIENKTNTDFLSLNSSSTEKNQNISQKGDTTYSKFFNHKNTAVGKKDPNNIDFLNSTDNISIDSKVYDVKKSKKTVDNETIDEITKKIQNISLTNKYKKRLRHLKRKYKKTEDDNIKFRTEIENHKNQIFKLAEEIKNLKSTEFNTFSNNLKDSLNAKSEIYFPVKQGFNKYDYKYEDGFDIRKNRSNFYKNNHEYKFDSKLKTDNLDNQTYNFDANIYPIQDKKDKKNQFDLNITNSKNFKDLTSNNYKENYLSDFKNNLAIDNKIIDKNHKNDSESEKLTNHRFSLKQQNRISENKENHYENISFRRSSSMPRYKMENDIIKTNSPISHKLSFGRNIFNLKNWKNAFGLNKNTEADKNDYLDNKEFKNREVERKPTIVIDSSHKIMDRNNENLREKNSNAIDENFIYSFKNKNDNKFSKKLNQTGIHNKNINDHLNYDNYPNRPKKTLSKKNNRIKYFSLEKDDDDVSFKSINKSNSFHETTIYQTAIENINNENLPKIDTQDLNINYDISNQNTKNQKIPITSRTNALNTIKYSNPLEFVGNRDTKISENHTIMGGFSRTFINKKELNDSHLLNSQTTPKDPSKKDIMIEKRLMSSLFEGRNYEHELEEINTIKKVLADETFNIPIKQSDFLNDKTKTKSNIDENKIGYFGQSQNDVFQTNKNKPIFLTTFNQNDIQKPNNKSIVNTHLEIHKQDQTDKPLTALWFDQNENYLEKITKTDLNSNAESKQNQNNSNQQKNIEVINNKNNTQDVTIDEESTTSSFKQMVFKTQKLREKFDGLEMQLKSIKGNGHDVISKKNINTEKYDNFFLSDAVDIENDPDVI